MQELEDSGLTRDEVLYNSQVLISFLCLNIITMIDWYSPCRRPILLICEEK